MKTHVKERLTLSLIGASFAVLMPLAMFRGRTVAGGPPTTESDAFPAVDPSDASGPSTHSPFGWMAESSLR